MATIKLTNSDLRKMISEAVSKLCEGAWYQSEPLCRLPYFVSVNFSDHAIDREDERNLSEDDIIANLKLAIQDIINDFHAKKIKPDDYLKVIDRDRCIVVICGIHPSYNGKRLHQVVVVTAYVWDGRINIDFGHTYYVNEPSEEYLEAKKWNEENQDKVVGYTEWKRDTDIDRQRRKAEKEYYWRNHPHEATPEKKMARLNHAFDSKEKREKLDIHDSLPDGDLEAIRDYFKHFDRRQLSSMDSVNKELWYDDMKRKEREKEKEAEAAKLSEMVNRAIKQALREHARQNMNTNTSRRKTR